MNFQDWLASVLGYPVPFGLWMLTVGGLSAAIKWHYDREIKTLERTISGLQIDLNRAHASPSPAGATTRSAPLVDWSNALLSERAFELAAEMRSIDGWRDAANELLQGQPQVVTESNLAAVEAIQQRVTEITLEARANYRRIQPEVIALRDVLVRRAPAHVVRARPQDADRLYERGPSATDRLDEPASDLVRLARALPLPS